MCSLKFLGPNHRHEEVNEEQQRNDADDDGFHVSLLEVVAKAYVERAHDKKQNDDCGKDEVVHKVRMCAQIKVGRSFRAWSIFALCFSKVGMELPLTRCDLDRRNASKASSLP